MVGAPGRGFLAHPAPPRQFAQRASWTRRPARGARDRIGGSTLGGGLDRLAPGRGLPSARARRDRLLALPGGRRPARRDGFAQARPRRRLGGWTADRARGGWLRQLSRLRRSPGRAAERRADLTGRCRPVKADAARTRRDPDVIDWIVAERIAAFVAGTGDAEPPSVDLAALATESETRVVA